MNLLCNEETYYGGKGIPRRCFLVSQFQDESLAVVLQYINIPPTSWYAFACI